LDSLLSKIIRIQLEAKKKAKELGKKKVKKKWKRILGKVSVG